MSSAAEWLHANAGTLADRVTETLFGGHPDWLQRYGARGREKCRQDAEYHVEYLRVAAMRGSPALFLDYVAWARVLLANLKVPTEDLASHLLCLEQQVAQLAPAEIAEDLTRLIARARTALPDMPDQLPDFIQPSAPHASLARRYLDTVLAGDRGVASKLIMDAADSGVSVKEIYLHVFQPALREVGRLWQTNAITVAHEHFCTAATQLVMSMLYPRIFSSERIGRTMIATCVEGDLHEIGVRMVADFFEMAGWDSHYLGGNVPVQSIVDTIDERQPELIAVSATMTRHVPKVAELIKRIRAGKHGSEARILVGGYPFNIDPDLWQAVGADASAADAHHAIELGG